jgi:anaerobic ribonucleoside-triphosphate reductase
MERSKGWFTKHSFTNDFVNKLEEIYTKYPDEVFNIQGIAHKHTDIAQFSHSFFKKSSANIADLTTDPNANVRERSIASYNSENNKALMKINSLFLMYKKVKESFDEESANAALEKVINGELFINDLTNFSMSYCYAFELRNLLFDGMNFFKGNMKIKAPKRTSSFIALVIQSTAYISNQIMGACSYPDFFVILDYFLRKDHGENYMNDLKSDKTIERDVKNHFQNLIYSFGFPFRSSQSAFTNLSVLDKGFMEALFKDYYLPEGEINTESTIDLSKLFFEYYSEINSKEGIFTFPVVTLAISLDENNEYVDPEFAQWAAEASCGKALANIFQSQADSFSSCCRMRSNFDGVAELGFQNSFGVGGLSIGSHRVAGLNLPRIALLENENPNIVDEDLDIVNKILISHRRLIKDINDRGHFPLYQTNWMSINRQYSTIGFIGSYEYLRNKGFDGRQQEGIDTLAALLGKIENKIMDWQKEFKGDAAIYNIEQIPGESMAVRCCELDTLLGYNKFDFKLYSNQYIPLIEEASIYDRFKIQGQIDSLTSGGAILHINVDDEKQLSATQFKRMMEIARKTKTKYFAINYAFSECEEQHYSIGKHDICPVCEKDITCQYTRVVGFLVAVDSWNKTRRGFEYPNRHFYKNGELEVKEFEEN